MFRLITHPVPVICLFFLALVVFRMKKNGAFTAYAWEPADDRAVADIRVIIKTFSFSKARQQRELAEFIRRSEEIERCVQRYQYLAERNHAITQDSAHAIDERQKRLFTRASRELKTLPWEVHELVQSLEEYRNDKYCKNVWIRDYLSTGARERRDRSSREECERRLGCCAATCGCCDRPWRDRPGLDGEESGMSFMRMASEKYNEAHCPIGCVLYSKERLSRLPGRR